MVSFFLNLIFICVQLLFKVSRFGKQCRPAQVGFLSIHLKQMCGYIFEDYRTQLKRGRREYTHMVVS